MGEWREAPLSEVCAEIYRYPSFYGMEKHDHGVPVVRGEHLLPSGRISTDWSDYWFVSEEYARQFPKTRLELYDVVMSVRGSIGVFSWVDSAHVGAQLSPNLIRLSPDPVQIEPAFFYYALKGSAAQSFITSTTSSSAVPAIRAFDIKLAEIPVPPLPEQRAIAHILGTLDDKIELNRRMSETLEAMARALFKSWFVDFDPVRAKMEGRAPGLPKPLADLFPDSLENSELGEIPKGWGVGCVNDLCSRIENGGTPKRMEPRYWGGSTPWFKTGELTDGPLLDSEEKITSDGLDESSCKLWPAGTILIALYASPTVGRLGILEVPGTSNQACSALLAKPELGRFFVFYSLMTTRDRLQQIAVGAAQQNISQQVVRNHKVLVPPGSIAQRFHKIVETSYRRRVGLGRQSRILAAQRDTLLPKLISGELFLNDPERFVAESSTESVKAQR